MITPEDAVDVAFWLIVHHEFERPVTSWSGSVPPSDDLTLASGATGISEDGGALDQPQETKPAPGSSGAGQEHAA